eukprot:2623467-Rhodomonas_salina.1
MPAIRDIKALRVAKSVDINDSEDSNTADDAKDEGGIELWIIIAGIGAGVGLLMCLVHASPSTLAPHSLPHTIIKRTHPNRAKR